MKKVKKIEIKINGKVIKTKDNIKLSALLKNLKIPIKKVAIELNQEIIDKTILNKINLKKMIRLK